MGPTSTGGSLHTSTIATIQRYLKTMADNITNGPGFLRYAKRKGLIVTEELVGAQELVPIDYGDNTNQQWFDDYHSFTTLPTDELKDSYVGHYNFRSGFHLGDIEQMENAGDAKQFDLLKVKLTTCERAMKIALSQALIGTQGSDTTRCPGIRDLMGGGTPSSITTSYQALSASTYTWWKPNVQIVTDGLGANNSNIRSKMIHQMRLLKKNLAQISCGICDGDFYEEFLKMVGGGAEVAGYPAPNVRNFSSDRVTAFDKGGGMVPDISYAGIDIVYDEYAAVPSAYTDGTDLHVQWIDAGRYYYKFDPRWNFKLLKPRPRSGDDEQWVDHYAVVARMCPICTSRRAHGITVFDI